MLGRVGVVQPGTQDAPGGPGGQGALVGGASLKAADFLGIIRAV